MDPGGTNVRHMRRARNWPKAVAGGFTAVTAMLLELDHRLIGNVNKFDDAGLRRPPNG
jgi:hypothetical protein